MPPSSFTPSQKAALPGKIFQLISARPATLCNFLDAPNLDLLPHENMGSDETRIVYRSYATLYFVFVVDSSESELGVLDLIQVRSFCTALPYLYIF